MRVAVIGGGAAGLTAAHELQRLGHDVLLFERGPRVGGQLRTVVVEGTPLECLYHHIFLSDTLVPELMEELGIGDRMQWHPSTVGFFSKGQVWNFVTPRDLLRFSPLSLVDRLRLGLVSLYLQRQPDWRRFESDTAERWLRAWAGQASFDTIWGPLLSGKFGGASPEVGMAWFHWKMRLRFGSRKGLNKEFLGYPRGSFAQLWEALGLRVQQDGGHVYTDSQVTGVRVVDGRAVAVEAALPAADAAAALSAGLAQPEGAHLVFPVDRVIAAVPSPALLRLVPELPSSYHSLLTATRYQANMCLLMTLVHPLSHIYWMNISDRTVPFVAVIEHTNLVDRAQYGGKHVVYLSNYIAADDPFYQTPDDEVLAAYLPHLRRINPAFDQSWIREWHVYREDAAQPIITANYSQQIPTLATPIAGLFLANNTQVYPEDRGQNYSIRIGREVAQAAARA
ncbi:MAG: NAD(P)/FAD-dependent oxidoreductase [Dehalococcoidia bacterium]|nr:NAD(P)/FAD-dependent oxidoreductase [Dehalococcoidia bacterium]